MNVKVITVTTCNPSSPESSMTSAHLTKDDAYAALRAHVEGYVDTEDVADEDLVDVIQDEGITVDFHEHTLTDEEDIRGCSCGQADYGTPGHDGDPNTSDPVSDSSDSERALALILGYMARTQENMGAAATTRDYLADIVMELVRSGEVRMDPSEYQNHYKFATNGKI